MTRMFTPEEMHKLLLADEYAAEAALYRQRVRTYAADPTLSEEDRAKWIALWRAMAERYQEASVLLAARIYCTPEGSP